MVEPSTDPNETRTWWALAGIAILVITIAGYFALGMPGMDHEPRSSQPDPMDQMDHRSAGARYESLGPRAFFERLTAPDTVLVNVHVPYEGELAGTDLFVPFDRITTTALSREDQVLIYCRSGDMSEQAAEELAATGFERVAHLAGGMLAWESSGREVLQAER